MAKKTFGIRRMRRNFDTKTRFPSLKGVNNRMKSKTTYNEKRSKRQPHQDKHCHP